MENLVYLIIAAVIHVSNCLQFASEYDFHEDLSQNFELEVRIKNLIIEKVNKNPLKLWLELILLKLWKYICQKEDRKCAFIKLDNDTQPNS